ncbi:MAG TPA: hypothetical protein VGB17_03055 [Pyrinomonadaceae bacterium]
MELGKMLAEALDVEPESALHLLADTLTEAANSDDGREKVRATSENRNLQISEQKRDLDTSDVDSLVHVEDRTAPDYGPGNRVGCGVPLSAELLETNAEAYETCYPPRPPGELPTAFRLMKESRELTIEYEEDLIYEEGVVQ